MTDILIDLFNPESGRLDAKLIAEEWNMPINLIAAAIGRKPAGVRKNPDGEAIQTELRRLYCIWAALLNLYAGNPAHARIFFHAPNRLLENRAPIEFIEKGDLAPLEILVDAMSVRQSA